MGTAGTEHPVESHEELCVAAIGNPFAFLPFCAVSQSCVFSAVRAKCCLCIDNGGYSSIKNRNY